MIWAPVTSANVGTNIIAAATNIDLGEDADAMQTWLDDDAVPSSELDKIAAPFLNHDTGFDLPRHVMKKLEAVVDTDAAIEST